ncbi:hypothetical protein L208DRAFT_1235067, partial [Tricholoma matsutake]
QEFQELEMLDDITTLCYNGKLPVSVVGECRNDLISAFCMVRGDKYIPPKVHRVIHWKDSDPFHLSVVSQFVPAKVTASKTVNFKKHRLSAEFNHTVPKPSLKRNKTVSSIITDQHAPISSPQGSQWSNNSCTFNGVMSILYNIWQDDARN